MGLEAYPQGPYLVVSNAGGQLLLGQYHPEAKQEHDESMACVAEHHRKQERESDDGVRGLKRGKKRINTQYQNATLRQKNNNFV